MENLGKFLQQKREEQDISIDDLASRTRIPLRFIKAIEAERFDLLPNRVTAKGFLRSYAECVDIDSTVITEFFDQYSPEDEMPRQMKNHDETLSYLDVKKTIRVPFPRRVLFSITGLIIILLIVVGLLSEKNSDKNTPPSLPLVSTQTLKKPTIPVPSGILELSEGGRSDELLPNEDETPIKLESALSEDILEEQAPKESRVPDEVSNVSDIIPLPSADSSETLEVSELDLSESTTENSAGDRLDDREVEGKEKFTLLLEAVEASWVQVTIDGNKVREALLQPNETVSWKADNKFLLTLGNAGGVRVKLDGQDLGRFGPSGEVVHREIVGKAP